MRDKLISGEISHEKQAEFVSHTISSGHESPVEHVSFTFALYAVSRTLTHQPVGYRMG